MKILRVLTVPLLIGCTVSAQDPTPPAARYLAAELIVKFQDSTPAAEVLGAGGDDPAEDPKLTAYVDEVGESLSVPLAVSQVTSGGEVLLAIDVAALVEDALKRIRRLEGIADARTLPPPEDGVQPTAAYLVSFVPGTDMAVALSAAGATEETAEKLDEIVDAFSQRLALPLAHRIADSELELTIDLQVLTESVMTRLQEMPEVEYVELDQLYEPMI